jgi:hypothetical protein
MSDLNKAEQEALGEKLRENPEVNRQQVPDPELGFQDLPEPEEAPVYSVEDHFILAQDPMQECAGSPIIPASNFDQLAADVAVYDEVKLTAVEILEIFDYQSKRFVACGGNLNDRFAVLRRNPESGWQYMVDLMIPPK